MKTHELSKALNHLSRVLRAGPNIELEDLANLNSYASISSKPKKSTKQDNDRGGALALLAQMAQYNKKELLELADFYGIPIEIRSADAVRDVLGKILRYIQDNPNVQDRLINTASASETGDAPQLARALAILMGKQ